jgi:glycosyltransferase involved in cell wall biosynthesis
VRSLIITQYAPLPPEKAVDGVYQRLATFVRAIGKVSDDIDFLGLVPQADYDTYGGPQLSRQLSELWGCAVKVALVPTARRIEGYWNHYFAGIFSSHMQQGLHHFVGPSQIHAVRAALQSNYDFVFVFRLPAILPVLLSGVRPRRMFFDLDDVEHISKARTAAQEKSFIRRLLYTAHAIPLVGVEMKAAARSCAMSVCSSNDATHLRRLGFGNNVVIIPNSVAGRDAPQGLTDKKTILYIGSFRYKPNRDGAERLISSVWPMIRKHHPDARLVIAGKNPEFISWFNQKSDNVVFTGFVQDLPALYADTRLVVCPLTVGAGTRIKLIEAASYGKPIVSTRIGAEGIDFRNGTDILLRDDDVSFAEACCQILDDIDLGRSLGGAAWRLSQSYDANKVICNIERLIRDRCAISVNV